MTSSPGTTCTTCGAPLTSSDADAPCPACLMELGLQTWQQQGASTRGIAATQDHSSRGSFLVEQDGELLDIAKLFPQLEILHLVGQGGMGAVYCARQKSLDRLVALKIIKPDKQNREKFADRFVREARALAQLNHPNIVTVHDFGEAEELYYFVMEYVDGINLRQMLQGKKLTARQALEIVPAVCDALQYAHDKGIVHRDIKPENILVDTDGNVKIADFGLAKLLDTESTGPALTQAFEVMGTMHYMAPEQIEKPLAVDHRADIYSLGVVFYELLTGELPLGRFAPPSHKAQVDIRLDEIVLQTLEKEPELRYQQVSDVKTAVSDLGAESFGRNYPEQAPSQPVPPPRVHPQTYPTSAPLYTVQPYSAPAAPVKVQDEPRLVPDIERLGAIPRAGFFGAMIHPRTYSNWLYLLMSFPLGLFYFTLTVTLLSVGFSLVIIWVGLGVLLGYFLLARLFAGFERRLTMHWLQTSVPILSEPKRYRGSIWDRTTSMFTSSRTWMAILFLLGKFPLGVISFVVSILALVVPLSIIALLYPPAWYPDYVDVNIGLPQGEGQIHPTVLALFTAFVLFFVLPHVVNGMAWLHAQWARLMLGQQPKQQSEW